MEKIRHKHTLARNHFSKIPAISKYFKPEGRRPSSMASLSGGGNSSSEMEQDNVGVNGTAVTLVT